MTHRDPHGIALRRCPELAAAAYGLASLHAPILRDGQPVVALPGYSRPLIRADDYLRLLEENILGRSRAAHLAAANGLVLEQRQPRRLRTHKRGFSLQPATPKCCDTDDRHPEAHEFRRVQAVSAPSKGNDQAVPTRPVHRKQQAAEKYEQRPEISQHRVADATRNWMWWKKRVPCGRSATGGSTRSASLAVSSGSDELPTALDNGQRSPRKLLKKVVARLLGRKPEPKTGHSLRDEVASRRLWLAYGG